MNSSISPTNTTSSVLLGNSTALCSPFNCTVNSTIPSYQYTPGRQYENLTIPRWDFNSSCVWLAATSVDLAFSITSLFYNGFIFLLPFLFSQMYNMRGALLSSYATACFFASFYYVYFDIRMLVSPNQVTTGEKSMVYVLILFLAYHVLLHMYLLSWDCNRRVFRCNNHTRYATTDRLRKLAFIVWAGSLVLAIIEACFVNNVSNFPDNPLVPQFRLVYVFILMASFWFIPLLITISWNGDMFCWLLKVIHNGHVVNEPEVIEEEYSPELMPELAPCPWEQQLNPEDDFDDEQPPEIPTLPDDIEYELTRCFAHLIVITSFGVPVLLWFTYHVFAMLRTGNYVDDYPFYDTVFNCYLYISLYACVKVIPLLNPLCYFYYGETRRGNFANVQDIILD